MLRLWDDKFRVIQRSYLFFLHSINELDQRIIIVTKYDF